MQQAESFGVAHGLYNCGSGLVALQHVGSQFPDQGSSSCPLNCKVDS